MDYTFFKDILFDLINECEQFDIQDLRCEDGGNCIILLTENGNRFEIRLFDRSGDKIAT